MFKKNMKKALALLASLLILCSLVPMSALLAANAAGENLVVNGDFETGDLTGWENLYGGCNVEFVGGRDGGSALKVSCGQWQMVRQAIAVEANADYVITAYSKSAANMTLLVKDGADSKNLAQDSFKAGDWNKITVSFNSGNNTKIYLSLMGNNPGATAIVDDVVMTKVGGGSGSDTPDEPASSAVIDIDFEDGKAHFDNGIVVEDGGSKCLKWSATGGWSSTYIVASGVEKDTDYVITFKMKTSIKKDVFITIQDANWGKHYNETISVSDTGWTKYTVTTNVKNCVSGDGKIMFKFQDTGDAMDIWVDDIVMVKKGDEPDQPDQPDEPTDGLVNGDFETGDATGWGTMQSTTISADAAHSGSYGAHLKGNGGWGTMLERTFDVTAGKSYELTFWAKANASGSNIKFLDKDWQGSALAEGIWFNNTSWTKKTVIITAASDKFYLQFCGSGSAAEDLYVDDVTLVELKDASNDGYITNGDFETGKIDGWTNLYDNNTVTMVSGYKSSYAVKIEAGEWTQFRQEITVEPNTDYVVWVYHKNSSKMTLLIKDGADKNNVMQNPLTSGSSWTLTTTEFNSGNNTKIFLGVMGNEASAGGTYDNFQMFKKGEEPELPDNPDEPDNPDNPDEPDQPSDLPTSIQNGDFENGKEGWSMGNSASIVDDAHKGTGALKLDNPGQWSEAALQAVAVEKNTNYVVTWYAKRVEGAGAFNLILMDGNDVNIKNISGATWMNETSGDWVKYEITVPTADANVLKFKFTTEAVNPGVILIDDLTMMKEGDEPEPADGNLIKNGSFEDGKDDWNWKEPTELSKDAFIGEASAKLDFNAAYGEALTQTVKIKPNTDYVMIWYTRRVSGGGAWDLFLMDYDTINISNKNVECEGQKWFNQTGKEWTESRISFNSGETTKLYVKFGPESNDSGVFLLDEVALYVKGTEPEGPIEPPTPPKTSMYLTSYGVVNNRPIISEKNMLTNGSFEKANGGQWQEGFTGDTISIVKDDTTRFGNKSLYFNTAGLETETKVVFWMDVEPDTSYVFSTWLKGKYMSDENRARATIGVVGEDLAYLEMDEYAMLDGSIQIVPTAWDNEWHLRSVEFNTGSATKVGIAMSGTNSQMYIDDMALFQVGHGTKYMSDNMKGSVSLSYSIDHYACKDEDSLIPDPNFNTKDKSGFWADSYGWRNNVLSFVDNKYEYGTSMKYTASDRTAPLSTIKWVEVEKETSYIFAVDLKILKDGFGKLVLFDDKLKDKINFLEVSFDSYDYDPAASRDGWYTIVCSFNTEVYERIGIAIVDDGGEVLLDNMRLFKKADGAEVEDDYIAPPTTTTTTEATTEWTDATTEWTDATTEWTDATTEWTDATTEWTEVPTYTYPTYTYPTWTYPTYTYPTYTYPTYTYPEYTDATTEWTDVTEWTDATTEWTEYYPEYTYPYYPEYTYPYYPEYTYPSDPFATEFPTDYTGAITWPEFIEPTYATDAPTEPSQAVEGESDDVFSTVMLWVGIGAGVAAVLAGGGFLVIMLIKKRKKAGSEIEIPEE